MIEASVKVSNSESRLTKKFLIYDDDIVLNTENHKLKAYVEQTLRDFEQSGKPDDVYMTLKMMF